MSDYYPKLVFPGLTDTEIDYVLAYTPSKEWCGAAAELSEGEVYPVHFITPLRAAQDMEISPEPVVENGLLVVPDTELVTMESAMREAAEQGFFSTLKPLEKIVHKSGTNEDPTSEKHPELIFTDVAVAKLPDALSLTDRFDGCDGFFVEMDGERYPITFMTPQRCKEVLKVSAVVVSTGLILVPSTDFKTMSAAVQQAWKWGFFSALKPVLKSPKNC